MSDIQGDGWCYHGDPPQDGDARKLVTLEQAGMTWVGIRAFHFEKRYWMNNNEPEAARVLAWRDLSDVAKGRWVRGKLMLRASPAEGGGE